MAPRCAIGRSVWERLRNALGRSWNVWERSGASGSVWERLGALGRSWGVWKRSRACGAAWRAPGAAEERLGVPGASGSAWERLDALRAVWAAPGARSAWAFLEHLGALGGVWKRLGAPRTACGAPGAAWRLGAPGTSGSAWGRRGRGSGVFYQGIAASGVSIAWLVYRESLFRQMYCQAPQIQWKLHVLIFSLWSPDPAS